MKEIEITMERMNLLEGYASSCQYEVLAKIEYPKGYEGRRKLCDLYSLKKEEFLDVDKVVVYYLIWCTGNSYISEYEINDLSELEECTSQYADSISIMEVDGEKIMFVYDIH